MSRLIRAALSGLIVITALFGSGSVQAGQQFPLGAPVAGSEMDGRVHVASIFGKSSKYSIDRKFRKQLVRFQTKEAPGTIIVMTGKKFLYLVVGDGMAIRYGIGTARDGFEWSGTHRVSNKREWPGWTPPPEMRKRQPGLPKYMPGGIKNPLGARALYIGATLYRIHGTNEPWTIGHDVSSGCIRMRNEDVEDLYDRVKIGAKVIVL